MIAEKISHLSQLTCSVCHKPYDAGIAQTFCTCASGNKAPLLAQYDFPTALGKDSIEKDDCSMWRYFEILPVRDKKNIVTLGEGWTPILPMNKLGNHLGMENLFMKDESLNPTGSFKARGMSAAISKA